MVRVKVSGIGGQSRWITGLAKSNEEVRIAQAALETAWGPYRLGVYGYGIRARLSKKNIPHS